MTKHRNRLAQETSPYLLQHQHNPVDWFPWGEAAFKQARQDDKPVFLSVGYSACHWCHVMAHESFENDETAALLNEHFISIKVDREERPDVDAIYMNAVQAMTGQGGWPMTVVMTADGKPFFGGTYFPPDDRYGRPGFRRILLALLDAWQKRREEILKSAEGLTRHLTQLSSFKSEGDLNEGVLTAAQDMLEQQFDTRHGGFGGAPKFPPHSALKLLLRQNDPNARHMAERTLNCLARGGIYDHLGGGFARYSVDDKWLVPHFEKMLYDNAQLVQRYAAAYGLTRDPCYQRVIEETLHWVTREMLDASGGFYSALDADSEGVEGEFYVWDEEEVDKLLGEDARLAKAYFGVSSMGNFEGKNILHLPHEKGAIAERFDLSLEAFEAKLATIKTTLFKEREARTRPGLDDKILTSWNGLMLAAFADAGRILKRQDYLDVAIRNAEFIRNKLYQDGRLFHSYKNGQAKIAGLLEDYAYYGLGLLSLYRATFDSRWLLLAFNLADVITTHFYDADNSGFFSTADYAEKLIVRPKDFFDAAVPSDNGATAEFLLMLARFSDRRDLEEMAASAIKPMVGALAKQPSGFGTLLCALQGLLEPPQEIAIFGDVEEADTQALLAVIDERPRPYTVVALIENEEDELIQKLPFLQNRGRLDGRATAYVCEAGACRLPVTSPEALREQLAAL